MAYDSATRLFGYILKLKNDEFAIKIDGSFIIH